MTEAFESRYISFDGRNSSYFVDPTTKMVIVSSYGFYGALGTLFNSLLICFQLKRFKHRKAYEYILFATTLVDFLNNLLRCTFFVYAVQFHDKFVCEYCGLFNTIFICSTVMLLTVNMLHRYLSLYHPAISKKISTSRGIILCSALPLLCNIVIYCPLLSLDVFGFDAVGSCAMKSLSNPNNKWIMFSGVQLFLGCILNIVLGLLVIRRLKWHAGQVQHIRSHIMKESKQIVNLMLILTIFPMISIGSGYTIRLFPPGTSATLWASRLTLSTSPSMFAFMPIIMIIVIKDYRKNFKRFLLCAANQVSSIELVGPNLEVGERNKAVLMVIFPLKTQTDTCNWLAGTGLYVHGFVNGDAQGVFVTLQWSFFGEYYGVPVCEESSCKTRVQHVRTQTRHDGEYFELWKPSFKVKDARKYQLVFGRENYTKVIRPVVINYPEHTICRNNRYYNLQYEVVEMEKELSE